ncbi:hypothetical protein DT250_18340 [Bacillus sp. AR2-1]|nr:hypothetical protein DT250_18340 [Bacillus sp. AR2-1]
MLLETRLISTYLSENEFFNKLKLNLGIFSFTFIILAKKTPSSRSVKGPIPVSRWEMNWLRTRDGRKPS